ncbi:MAG: HAD family hydrolase [Oscillospiraceae bacterium]|nr:HAD family hydrolase [Oscillospiraceae bacterium]
MKITTVFFDLDGTLLPMDQDVFVNDYFRRLAIQLAPEGYKPDALFKAIWSGTAAMVKNRSDKLNREVFWEAFFSVYPNRPRSDIDLCDKFYTGDFENVRHVCGHDPRAAKIVYWLKENGFRVVLATNPIFPSTATQARIRWAGLQPEDFELYTTYDNSRRCKPNPEYYQEILDKIGCDAEECLMVGNDATEDTAAEKLGMKVFLLTGCLINKENRDISPYPHGDFDRLAEYLKTI